MGNCAAGRRPGRVGPAFPAPAKTLFAAKPHFRYLIDHGNHGCSEGAAACSEIAADDAAIAPFVSSEAAPGGEAAADSARLEGRPYSSFRNPVQLTGATLGVASRRDNLGRRHPRDLCGWGGPFSDRVHRSDPIGFAPADAEHRTREPPGRSFGTKSQERGWYGSCRSLMPPFPLKRQG
jgi:hypothetical protein